MPAAGLSIVGMFCNFGALARLPLIEANAISFMSPLIRVALAAVILKERVRIYRWSAVTVGFIGVLVVLAPHFTGDELAIAGERDQRRRRDLRDRRLVHQCRNDDPDPAPDQERDHVIDRALFFADLLARRSGHLAVRLDHAEPR